MSNVEQARQAARAVVNQDGTPTNVRNLRGYRVDVYDANSEVRQLSLNAYDWTLILISLRRLGLQEAADLADRTEQRLKHPSSGAS